MKTVKIMIRSIQNIFGPIFYSPYNLMAYEAKKIFSNEDDSKKYTDAVFKLKTLESEEETITLSTGETITLIS